MNQDLNGKKYWFMGRRAGKSVALKYPMNFNRQDKILSIIVDGAVAHVHPFPYGGKYYKDILSDGYYEAKVVSMTGSRGDEIPSFKYVKCTKDQNLLISVLES